MITIERRKVEPQEATHEPSHIHIPRPSRLRPAAAPIVDDEEAEDEQRAGALLAQVA